MISAPSTRAAGVSGAEASAWARGGRRATTTTATLTCRLDMHAFIPYGNRRRAGTTLVRDLSFRPGHRGSKIHKRPSHSSHSSRHPSMTPRAEEARSPRSPRGRALHLTDDLRPRSPFPMPAATPAAVSTAHVSVETSSSLDASTSSSLLSPPRPRLPSSRSAPSVSAAAASASPFTSDESRAPSPAVASLAATPRTPRSRRVSASGATPIRTPSRKGKERAAEVDADALGEVSVEGNARRGLRELVARDERRRERERERDRERGLPVASTRGELAIVPVN